MLNLAREISAVDKEGKGGKILRQKESERKRRVVGGWWITNAFPKSGSYLLLSTAQNSGKEKGRNKTTDRFFSFGLARLLLCINGM